MDSFFINMAVPKKRTSVRHKRHFLLNIKKKQVAIKKKIYFNVKKI
jgi:hypothetical protein